MPQLGALFSFSELVISADSGPLHVAGGVGTSVIALFGPTDARSTGPRGRGPSFIIKKVPQRCSVPCFDTTCNTAECMEEIRADDVLNIIQEHNLIQPYAVKE